MRYILFGFILLLLAMGASADTIRLHPQAAVSGVGITLGDVAELEGATALTLRTLRVGRMPVGASEVVVQFSTVQRHLEEAAVNLSQLTVKGARSCRVVSSDGATNQTQTEEDEQGVSHVVVVSDDMLDLAVDPEVSLESSVSQRITEALYRLAGAEPDSLEVTYRGGRDTAAWLNAPAPRGLVEIRPQSRTGLGRVPVRVRRFDADGAVHEITLTADVVRQVETVVVVSPIGRGDRFTLDNVAMQRVALGQAHGTPVATLDALLGQAASASLRVGTAVLAKHLQPDLLVKRGDLVTVLVRRGRLAIRTVGRAAENGVKGAVITFRNDETREHFYATVTGPRTATIADPAASLSLAQN
ncbi:MAG: flagellar basal body P-ring formation chaperone FlgA [Algisphaera sp.]